MHGMEKLLVFTLSDLCYALPLADVERILRAVAISPLPKAPEIIMGLVNIQGRILPVLNIRKFFCLPEIEMALNDQIIIARTANRSLAIIVDKVLGVSEYNERDIIEPEKLFPGIEFLEGVAKLGDGIIYIYSLDRFISSQEEDVVEHLLSPAGALPVDEEG